MKLPLRALPAVVTLVLGAPVLAACGAPADEPTAVRTSEAISCTSTTCGTGGPGNKPAPPPPPPPPPPVPTPAECATVRPACTIGTPLGQGSWQNATPAYYAPNGDNSAQLAGQAWIAALIAAGCPAPGEFGFPITNLPTSAETGLWFTICPASVAQTIAPPPTETWASLEIECNACIPVAPAGSITIGWDIRMQQPAGCKDGSCASWH